MIITFNDVYINTNSVKYIEPTNDPSSELAIWDLNKQIESEKRRWWLRTPMQDLFVKQLERERDNYQQKFHVDIAFVDGSEMRESFNSIEERDLRLNELLESM
jgi:hypothetical protein